MPAAADVNRQLNFAWIDAVDATNCRMRQFSAAGFENALRFQELQPLRDMLADDNPDLRMQLSGAQAEHASQQAAQVRCAVRPSRMRTQGAGDGAVNHRRDVHDDVADSRSRPGGKLPSACAPALGNSLRSFLLATPSWPISRGPFSVDCRFHLAWQRDGQAD